jgi:hypothetical protein
MSASGAACGGSTRKKNVDPVLLLSPEPLDSSLLALYFCPLRLRDFRFCILPEDWLLASFDR